MIVESVLLTCLVWNVYFEAKGEPLTGQVAVAEVTLRRAALRPDGENVCHTVFDGRAFSWTVLIEDPSVKDAQAWGEAIAAANMALHSKTNYSLGADHYHATYIKLPRWARSGKLCETTRIGLHVFYKPCEAEQ